MSVIRPYEVFDSTPISDRIELIKKQSVARKLDLILLNGPAGSGKTYLAKRIQQHFGKKCRVFSLPETLYRLMGEAGLPDTELSYAEFKKQPHGRQALIESAKRFKFGHDSILMDAIITSQEWDDPKISCGIIDNVGFTHEADYWTDYANELLMINIITPHGVTAQQSNCYHNIWFDADIWPGDSRGPVQVSRRVNYGPTRNMVQSESTNVHDMVLTHCSPDLSEQRVARYSGFSAGTLRRIWQNCQTVPPAMHDLFDSTPET